MRRALLVGALDVNVTPWRGEPNDRNWGWRTRTSDSLFLVWHRIDRAGSVSTRSGAIISTLGAGLSITDDPEGTLPPSEIAPPIEQSFPFMAGPPDVEYADALFGVLHRGDARCAATRDSDRLARLGVEKHDKHQRRDPHPALEGRL